jgi:nucleotide sugar dehydrogenase
MSEKIKTIGIIGQGFVGTAVREQFKKHFNIKAYDKFDKEKSVTYGKDTIFEDVPTNSISTIVEDCNLIFVCVPTPMFEDGECDISIVESVIDDVAKEAEFQNKKVIVILKSTVPPGTTKTLNGMSPNVGVVFSPEFLTEANAISDFANQTRVVLGIDYVELVDPIIEIFKKGLPNAENIVINSDEAEMTKYTTNLFLATKVSFFNDIYTF